MVGWHHRLNGHEFGEAPGVGDEQGGLACCGSWGHKESDKTDQLNGTELKGKRPPKVNPRRMTPKLFHMLSLPWNVWDFFCCCCSFLNPCLPEEGTFIFQVPGSHLGLLCEVFPFFPSSSLFQAKLGPCFSLALSFLSVNYNYYKI